MPLNRGRPRVENPREFVRSVHLSKAELDLIEAAAEHEGQPVTGYIREKALGAARRAPRK